MLGDEVQVAFTKWDGSPHWHVPTRHLGDDEHGTWLHSPTGTHTWHPGAQLIYQHPSLVCVPRHQHWVATLYDTTTPGTLQTYVDITTPATWSPGAVTMVDLDPDVVQCVGGVPFVDDEDEFTLHRHRYRYPDHLVRAAREACAAVLAAVTHSSPPFDESTASRWLAAADPTWASVPPPAPPD